MTVPTVDLGLLLVVFCSMLTAGERPLMCSTFGFWKRREELAGVAGEALDVASLPLGIEGIDGQRYSCPTRSGRCTPSSCGEGS